MGQVTETYRTLRGTTRMAINRNTEILAYPSSCSSKNGTSTVKEWIRQLEGQIRSR